MNKDDPYWLWTETCQETIISYYSLLLNEQGGYFSEQH